MSADPVSEEKSPAAGPPPWPDAFTRTSLQTIVDSVVRLAGFDLAVVSVLRDDGRLHPVAIAGTVEDYDWDRAAPADLVLAELKKADDWGRFKFIPAEYAGSGVRDHAWIPEYAPGDTDDAWRPLDFLIAPFYDDTGQLRGILSMDLPDNGLRPGPARREVLDQHAALAERALLLALARTELEQRERLADTARDVVRRMSRALSLGQALDEAREPLIEAFDLRDLWIWLFDDMVREHALNVGLTQSPDRKLWDATRAAMPRLWRARRAGLVGSDYRTSSAPNDNLALGRSYMAEHGFGSAVYTPVASGDRILGALVLLRGTEAQPWSNYELEVAFEIGRDLGRILTNVATFEREKSLAGELHRLDAFKSDLISTVSHELKNPLTSILGNLDLIAHEESPERTAGAIGALGRSTYRMAGIVDELRELYDTDPDRRPSQELVDLVPLARGACELLWTTAAQRNLSLDLDLPSSPTLTPGEARELDRVLVNLVSNAVKYTPNGGTVSVSVRSTEGGVEVRIRDTGIGISADDQSHLFDEFFRSPDPAARTQPGTGLGLTIVDRIVRRHGGRIDVVSDVGAGSTFTVHLPSARGGS